MKATLIKGQIQTVDPDTGEVVATSDVSTPEARAKRRLKHYRMEKIMKAEKPILENMLFKDIERNGGPIENDDFIIHEQSMQMREYPASSVFTILDDVDLFVDMLKPGAVKKAAIAEAVKEGRITKEQASEIAKAETMLPQARHFTKVERKKFDTKEDA